VELSYLYRLAPFTSLRHIAGILTANSQTVHEALKDHKTEVKLKEHNCQQTAQVSHTSYYSARRLPEFITSQRPQLSVASHHSPLSLTTMSSSQYPVPPPSYIPSGSSRKPPPAFAEDDATSPLLGRSRSPGGGIYDQPQQGDLPDDFKVFLLWNYVICAF
jgi:hypothetical protein